MAGSKRPSFLKRQKEQARVARAAEKRAARLARRNAKAAAAEGGVIDPEDEMLAAGEEFLRELREPES